MDIFSVNNTQQKVKVYSLVVSGGLRAELLRVLRDWTASVNDRGVLGHPGACERGAGVGFGLFYGSMSLTSEMCQRLFDCVAAHDHSGPVSQRHHIGIIVVSQWRCSGAVLSAPARQRFSSTKITALSESLDL